MMWGGALFAEAMLRVVGAYTLSVDTMVWAGGVIATVTFTLTIFVSGALVIGPMEKMVGATLSYARSFAPGADRYGDGHERPRTVDVGRGSHGL
ncbi:MULTISPECIES: hypothetical protein [Streptomyces]|uniref:hypothetical protein n=1 Tax=Streptomyces TaxID=1883 RepID=UPI001E6035C3|nr:MULTISPECIES: hypothetical protein [Streptomyces]UFQ17277.1 hypothetical protein J2N69_21020 [Streptomyces huasconensis]WCL86882.1 hypothetical protein PPN52_21025 [Streptomyces sp. JCM 35825]